MATKRSDQTTDAKFATVMQAEVMEIQSKIIDDWTTDQVLALSSENDEDEDEDELDEDESDDSDVDEDDSDIDEDDSDDNLIARHSTNR